MQRCLLRQVAEIEALSVFLYLLYIKQASKFGKFKQCLGLAGGKFLAMDASFKDLLGGFSLLALKFIAITYLCNRENCSPKSRIVSKSTDDRQPAHNLADNRRWPAYPGW